MCIFLHSTLINVLDNKHHTRKSIVMLQPSLKSRKHLTVVKYSDFLVHFSKLYYLFQALRAQIIKSPY